MKKGFIVFYINFQDHVVGQSFFDTVSLIKEQNKGFLDRCNELGYDVMWIPTQGEASRVEKIDYEKPHPMKNSLAEKN